MIDTGINSLKDALDIGDKIKREVNKKYR